MMRVRKVLGTEAILAIVLLLAASRSSAQTEMDPQSLAQEIYSGIQYLHGYQATPRLFFGVRPGVPSSCGRIWGSAYCPADHALFITANDIAMAYEHGDAALAYIIAHEYAHAVQTAFRFKPGITPISELQADCLAGLYLGSIPTLTFDTSDLLEIGSLAHRLGDYGWGREHHGTPQQRIKAVALGLDASRRGMEGARACSVY